MAGMHKRGLDRRANSRAREFLFYRRSNRLKSPSDNLILAAVPPEEYERLRPCLELVPLQSGSILWEANLPIKSVYFPTGGMVSLVAIARNGATVGVGMIGREGFVGIPVVLGVRSALTRAVVQIQGNAFRIDSDLLVRTLPESPRLVQMLLRYAHTYATQVAQAAACNCLHRVPERLSRWLAMGSDRAGSDLLPVTQESLAQMLGCRRSSVTAAVGTLQNAGAIRCRRGHVRIVKRGELERRACECYAVMRRLSHPASIE